MDLITCCIAAVGLHVGSAHFAPEPNSEKLNGVNPGIYVKFTNDVVLGTFRNSHNRQSTYLAYEFKLGNNPTLQPSVLLGGITGYSAAPVLPLVSPSVLWQVSPHTGVRLSYIPKVRIMRAHVVHLSLEYTF